MAQVSRYHPALVALHWLLALMIIAALALGTLVLVKIPNSDPMKIDALRNHMIGGVLILTDACAVAGSYAHHTPGAGPGSLPPDFWVLTPRIFHRASFITCFRDS